MSTWKSVAITFTPDEWPRDGRPDLDPAISAMGRLRAESGIASDAMTAFREAWER